MINCSSSADVLTLAHHGLWNIQALAVHTQSRVLYFIINIRILRPSIFNLNELIVYSCFATPVVFIQRCLLQTTTYNSIWLGIVNSIDCQCVCTRVIHASKDKCKCISLYSSWSLLISWVKRSEHETSPECFSDNHLTMYLMQFHHNKRHQY